MLSVLDKWEEAKKKLNDYISLYKIPYEKLRFHLVVVRTLQ